MVEKTEEERLLSCEEVRFWHEHKGVAAYVLAELNACSEQTIKKILDGRIKSWSEVNENDSTRHNSGYVVVNSTEGRFYPSVRSCETIEGITHSLLASRFHSTRCYIVNSTEGRIYPSVDEAEKVEGVKLKQRFKKGRTKAKVGNTEYHLYRFKGGTTRTILNGFEYHLYKVGD